MRRAHVPLADAVLVEDTRGHLKRYKRLGIRTVWITGHLPSVLNASGAISLRSGDRLRRWHALLQRPPERREDPQATTLLVADAGRGHQEIAGKAVRGDADRL